MGPLGSLRSCSRQPLPAPLSSTPPRTLDPAFQLCSPPSALCSLVSTLLNSWSHGAQHPLSLPRKPPGKCRAHPHTPGHHQLGDWPARRPGWLWRAIFRSEASSPSGLCPSFRMWRRKEVALNARCRERGISGHALALAPRLQGPQRSLAAQAIPLRLRDGADREGRQSPAKKCPRAPPNIDLPVGSGKILLDLFTD